MTCTSIRLAEALGVDSELLMTPEQNREFYNRYVEHMTPIIDELDRKRALSEQSFYRKILH
jgi:hypothetical protein